MYLDIKERPHFGSSKPNIKQSGQILLKKIKQANSNLYYRTYSKNVKQLINFHKVQYDEAVTEYKQSVIEYETSKN
jgi:hypothetical protein